MYAHRRHDHAGVQVIQQPLLTGGAVTTVRLRTRLDHLCSSNGAPGANGAGTQFKGVAQIELCAPTYQFAARSRGERFRIGSKGRFGDWFTRAQ
jgi:hypothetical protein